MELNEPFEGHEHATTSLKVVLLVFAIVLVGALAYLIQATYSQPDTTEETAPSVKDKTEQAATLSEDCPTATADQKAYESANLGFCFVYPDPWIMTDGAGKEGDKRTWYVSLTDKVVPNSDYPGMVSVNIYSKIADMDSNSTGATTLKDYLDKSAALTDPLYKDVKAATVGGKSGFSAKPGTGQFAPAHMYYFLTLTDGSIMEVTLFYDNAGAIAVFDSLKVTK